MTSRPSFDGLETRFFIGAPEPAPSPAGAAVNSGRAANFASEVMP